MYVNYWGYKSLYTPIGYTLGMPQQLTENAHKATFLVERY